MATLSTKQKDELEEAALMAFGGTVRKDLAHGVRTFKDKAQVSAVYFSDNEPENDVEIAFCESRLSEHYDLKMVHAWIRREQAAHAIPCNTHKHGSDWPIIGLSFAEAIQFFARCRKLRLGRLPEEEVAMLRKQIAVESPEEAKSTQIRLALSSLRPTIQPELMDLVRSAGIDVSGWSDVLRGAFNTPFWPHVVASTSVGQEGLDFHTWCSRIGHWDICPGPVEIEQREGRVSRFAGLVVRNALAKEMEIHGALLESPKGLPAAPPSVWKKVADLAKEDGTGLQPWWHVPGADIQRYRFSLDLSRDEHKFGHLQSQRMIYRLALGHPNQHDLIRTLAVDDAETLAILQGLVLNLSPFGAPPQNER